MSLSFPPPFSHTPKQKRSNQGVPLFPEEKRLEIDLLTLAAISALAWVAVNVAHEVIGHAGAAALLGIPVRAVSTTAATIAWEYVTSSSAYRTIMAAGTVVNLLTGGAALILLRLQRQAHAATRTFLWLFATFSFIIVTLNLVSAPVMGVGDWTEFTRELEPRGLWTALIVGAGIIIAVAGYSMPLRLWMPDLRGNRRAQLTVTIIPVLTLIVVQSLSLIGSPVLRLSTGAAHILACVFAYLHFILWALLVNILPAPRSKAPPESLRLPRSYDWLALGLLTALFAIGVLGAEIDFTE